MNGRRLATGGLVAMLIVVLGGCGFFKPALETGDRDQALQPQSIGQGRVETIDDLFAKVAQQVPAFGGMFFEAAGRQYTGVLYIHLLDPGQKEAAAKAIVEVFGPIWPEIIPPREIRVLQAQYSFLQLKEWFDLIGILHNMPEVTMSDIDDVKNRLTIGLMEMNVETVTLVEQELARLGIPREAVEFEETGPFIPDVALTIEQALDENRNNFLDDVELLKALDLWVRQAPVPGTDGLTISDAKLIALIGIWQARRPL